MSKLEDFAFEDVMSAAVKEFGSDPGMESATNVEELVESIGESEVPRLVERLDNA